MKKKLVNILLGLSVAVNIITATTLYNVATETASKATTEMVVKAAKATETKSDVQIITSDTPNDKVYDILANRNGSVVIEVIEGKVLDDHGNGEYRYGEFDYYIHYDPETFHKGDEVVSIFVYDPETNVEDDIVHRYHILKH